MPAPCPVWITGVFSLVSLGITGWLGGSFLEGHRVVSTLSFLGMLLRERTFTYRCGRSSLCKSGSWRWQKLSCSPGAACSRGSRHRARGWLRKQGWASTAGLWREAGNALSSAAVRVKHMWTSEQVSLRQCGATAQVIAGQPRAATSEQGCKQGRWRQGGTYLEENVIPRESQRREKKKGCS